MKRLAPASGPVATGASAGSLVVELGVTNSALGPPEAEAPAGVGIGSNSSDDGDASAGGAEDCAGSPEVVGGPTGEAPIGAGVIAMGAIGAGVITIGVMGAGVITIGVMGAGVITIGVMGAGVITIGVIGAGVIAIGAAGPMAATGWAVAASTLEGSWTPAELGRMTPPCNLRPATTSAIPAIALAGTLPAAVQQQEKSKLCANALA